MQLRERSSSDEPDPAGAAAEKATASPWSPLRQPLFRGLWLASVASNIGTWMQDTGAAWLMTTLAPTPEWVAGVQVATTLPILILALPAGALADILDRRRLLIVAQLWMLTMAGLLGAVTLLHRTTPESLLALTLALGMGSALSMPAWAAMVPELVPRDQLRSAITLNALAMNVSRALGPALAGLLIAEAGPGPVFLLNAASFMGIVMVLGAWQRAPRESALPAERMLGAMRAGLRYARHSPALLRVIVRIAAFFTFASAPWALLPLLVRTVWRGGPADYGLMLGAMGCGAIGAVLLLPRLRHRVADDWLVGLGSFVYAGMLAALAVVPGVLTGLGVAMVAGGSWLSVMTTLQGAAQVALPGWVRARGLSLAMVAMMAGMAGGSLLWGRIAGLSSIPDALMIAAIGMTAVTLLTLPLRIGGLEQHDLTPSMHWPLPVVDPNLEHHRGPVLVTLAYRVSADRRAEFQRLMKRLRQARRRDGAYHWQLFSDAARPDRYLEAFLVESWVEHLRQHERVTVDDRRLQARVHACLVEPTAPRVSHWIAESGWGAAPLGSVDGVGVATAIESDAKPVQPDWRMPMPTIQVEHAVGEARLTELGARRWPIWEKEISSFPWHYDSTETCYLLDGEVVVTPEGGEPVHFGKGDLVVFPRGLSCVWDIRKPVRKHYAFS